LKEFLWKAFVDAFEVSMPWLLEFIDSLIAKIPQDLNAEVVAEDDEIEVIVFEAMSYGVM